MSVSAAAEKDWKEWDDFVLSRPLSYYYQSSSWMRFLSEYVSYGQKSLIARRGGSVTGVLPLFLVSKPLLGSKLISIPFDMTVGGVLSDDADSRSALLARAVETGRLSGCKYIEIRPSSADREALSLGFKEHRPFVWGKIPLTGIEANYKRTDSSRRNDINRCRKSGVEIAERSSINDLRDYYYRVMIPHFREKGTPLFSFDYLKALWLRGGPPEKNMALITARLNNAVIGGIILFRHGNTVTLKALASLPGYRRMGVNAAIGWAGIEYGLRNGCKMLNFGISERDKPGQSHFKQDLGAEIEETFSYTLALGGTPVPLEKFSEDRTRFVRKVWSLLPRAVTGPAGKFITEWLC